MFVKMFVTRFIRSDGKPDEDFVYYTKAEAEAHLRLFTEDSSGLYRNISVIDLDRDLVLAIILFRDGKPVDTFTENCIVRLNKNFCSPGEEKYLFAVKNINEQTERCTIHCLNSKLALGSSELVGLEMIHTVGTTLEEMLTAAKRERSQS